MIDAFLAKVRARDEISEEEEAILRAAVSESRDIPADKTVVHAGERLSFSVLLLDGLTCRAKDLSDGSRQIAELNMAGDFIDLHGYTLHRLDHSISTLTPCRVALVPHERLDEITEGHPRLTRILWFLTNLDAAIHREWELSLGRRSAIAHIAHLFRELHVRLGIVGLADRDGYDLRLTQTELAECTGLTPVHVNRTLRELRERGVAEFKGGRVNILDLAELERVGEFDPTYLYLDRLLS